MEILFVIAPMLIIGVVGYFTIFVQEWITDMWFYRRRAKKEQDRIGRLLAKVEYAKHSLPTGEVETLGPGKVYIFGGPKVGIVTGTSLRSNEELEEMDEAERLLKEACDRTIAPS